MANSFHHGVTLIKNLALAKQRIRDYTSAALEEQAIQEKTGITAQFSFP
jgi:hypothetical protein